MNDFNPSYVLYAHKSKSCPDKAAYVYIEKDDDGKDNLSFAMLHKDEKGNAEVVDKASYLLDIETYPKNFVYGDMKAITAIGNAECGLLFILVNTSDGKWKLQITTESEFGCIETEECEVMIPFNWLPF